MRLGNVKPVRPVRKSQADKEPNQQKRPEDFQPKHENQPSVAEQDSTRGIESTLSEQHTNLAGPPTGRDKLA